MEVPMTKEQRYRYEMFVRVRDFGASRTTMFPPASKAGQAFATVTSAVAAIDDHQKNHVVGQTEARRVKATTRAAVFDTMKTIALAARRVTRPERGESPFRIPRRRSLAREIATARAFIEEAEKRQDEFVSFGLPPTFIADFRTAVDELQQAVAVRLSSKTVRRQALAGIDTELARGFDAIRDLDVLVAIATREDPTTFAAWTAARRIEGQGSTASAAKHEPEAAADAAAPDVDAAGGADAAAAATETAPAEAAPASADEGALAKAS
jgi:hypothetical protein